jgi:hypothetical protein
MLGKLSPKIDIRTLRLKTLINIVNLPPIPESYDVDSTHQLPITEQMFGNDRWGDCVIVSRANQTLRFECCEQQQVIPITESDILRQYWNEQCPWFGRFFRPDKGLVMLNSINLWRKIGWKINGKQYNTLAFASINKSLKKEIKQGIYLLNGLQVGIQVPQSALNQFNNNQPWELINPVDYNIRGGHAIYIVGYNQIGPVCVTWGKKQQMTWAWWDVYVDEVYALVDNKNPWMKTNTIDFELLKKYLEALTGGK